MKLFILIILSLMILSIAYVMVIDAQAQDTICNPEAEPPGQCTSAVYLPAVMKGIRSMRRGQCWWHNIFEPYPPCWCIPTSDEPAEYIPWGCPGHDYGN